MPTIKSKINNVCRVYDARPDRVDLRDRKYQPRLVNLPASHPTVHDLRAILPAYAGLVLDQGSEGSCTGFGLAAMINFLRFKSAYQAANAKGGTRKKAVLPPNVSPRMLYDNARLYDEWEGEDYQGSSCRGALKGWQRHGVCTEAAWPYGTEKKPGKPKSIWQKEAAEIMLGAYYRVEVDDLTALQSAVCEVGAVYVSADTHNGWSVGKNAKVMPKIGWDGNQEKAGGHAFALVGYNQEGFIVQNSWGTSWGFHGFAVISYQDWLSNATDAWVATLGVPQVGMLVPAHFSSQSLLKLAGSATTAAGGTDSTRPWGEDETMQHCLVLGNEGRMIRKMVTQTPTEYVKKTLMKSISEWMKESPDNTRIVIYAHGGLNSQTDGIKRASIMGPYFKANGVFPIFIVWKTGFLESMYDIGDDWMVKRLPGLIDLAPDTAGSAFTDWLGRQLDKTSDKWDGSVESGAPGRWGKSLWNEMKDNAAVKAAAMEDHGCSVLSKALYAFLAANSGAGLHLIGHSAGSIWHGHFLSMLGNMEGVSAKIQSCHLFAPACTVEFANEHYIKALGNGLLSPEKLFFHLMNDEAERQDNCLHVYRKSLLYFVSRACEEHKTALLGMEATWKKDVADALDIFAKNQSGILKKWRDFVAATGIPTPNFIPPGYIVVKNAKKIDTPSHGGFDNDIHVIGQTIERILGVKPPFPVTDLYKV